MINTFVETFKRNLLTRRQQTVTAATALLIAVFILWFILDAMFWIMFWGLPVAILLVAVAAYQIPALSWFWGQPEISAEKPKVQETRVSSESYSDKSAEDAMLLKETQAAVNKPYLAEQSSVNVVMGAITPRQTPKGTNLISQERDKAVLEVKAAIRFWCWFLPLTFVAVAIIGSPIGAAIGFAVYEADPNTWQLNPISYTVWGSIYWVLAFLAAAVASYLLTRSKVEVVVLPSTITFGDYKFDRKYSDGIRIGYQTNEVNLPTSLLQPRLGMIALRCSYGPWGEDMKYLVDAYHAHEVVTWMNQIIDSVGGLEAKRHDPYAGKKVELL